MSDGMFFSQTPTLCSITLNYRAWVLPRFSVAIVVTFRVGRSITQLAPRPSLRAGVQFNRPQITVTDTAGNSRTLQATSPAGVVATVSVTDVGVGYRRHGLD